MGRRAGVGLVGALTAVVVLLAGGLSAPRAEGPVPVGTVTAVTGAVEVGRDGVWQPVTVKTSLFEGQVIRTAAAASVEILFEGQVPAALGEKAEIAVADLQLKAQLEKTKARIAEPADAKKAEMQVTPMTGVRGTEKTEEKAGDLKREHYWDEGVPAAK